MSDATQRGRLDVLLLSRYDASGASSRVRMYQYLPSLAADGIHVTAAPLLGDGYVDRLYRHEPQPAGALLRAYADRVRWLARRRRFDLLWVEYELFPWLPATAERLLARLSTRVVVEYDDAVFHRYDSDPRPWVRRLLGQKIDRVMRAASLVIAGNDYLAARAYAAGAARVELLPSVVDLAKYDVAPNDPAPNVSPGARPVTIGWMGTPVTAPYLRAIAPALDRLVRTQLARVVLVGAGGRPLDYGFPCEIHPWSEADEAREIARFDIGIMPLADDPWSRGKCGYKLIQYMAAARPVIASPVGVNRALVETHRTGLLAKTPDEWFQALRTLSADAALRRRYGLAGRALVERAYRLQVTAPRLASLLRSAASASTTSSAP